MSVHLVEVELSDHQVIMAEVDARGPIPVGANKYRFNMETFRSEVAGVSKAVIESVLDGLPDPPDRLGLQFGLKLVLESGSVASVLAKASGEASITVHLEWDRSVHGT